ncbi:hypothetical protein [Deinococcus sp.]|uniref:hypothetical protein n=1 Tax=Deinococcus sp. TaxID=47478 RepID=UPI003CC64A30
MRTLTVLLLLLAAALLVVAYNYGGIKLGIVTVTPTQMWNVTGEGSYSYLNIGNGVTVQGTCQASSGVAVLRLYSNDGLQIAGQQCSKGDWSIQLATKGALLPYRLSTEYRHFSGNIDINVVR